MITRQEFGKLPEGKPVFLYTIENKNGLKIQLSNYGARIVSAYLPDRDGNSSSVILGYSCLEHYIKGHSYLGATVGRVANRIGKAKFEINGKVYNLTKNLGENHLHGGIVGFESLCWETLQSDNDSIEFSIVSPDGDQGYPGNLIVKVRYTLKEDNSIRIDFKACTDTPTIINMTNHAYFNLSNDTENIYRHKAQFLANKYLDTDEESVPTGRVLEVENTPLDFKNYKFIGSEINSLDCPIARTKGYDQFFITNKYRKGQLNLMAEVEEPYSGRVLQVFSTLPGFQFYTSNFLDTVYPTLNGKIYGKHSAFCIEPSYLIDAPNHANFPSIMLNPTESYNETIVYKFLIRY